MNKPIAEQNHAQQNLIEMILFLGIAIFAYSFKDFNLFETCSEPVKQILGYPPQAIYVSYAMMVYLFSAFVIRVTSIAQDIKPIVKWSHLGYRSIFFVFYSFSGTIADNFFPVLLIGMFLYTLDQYHIFHYNHEHKGAYHES